MTNISTKKTLELTAPPARHGKKVHILRRAKVTKKAKLISFLSKDRGVDIGSLSKKLDWRPHTTRAALSKLRKSGYVITSAKSRNSKLARYRITSLPDGHGA
jgi:hypothetical protein